MPVFRDLQTQRQRLLQKELWNMTRMPAVIITMNIMKANAVIIMRAGINMVTKTATAAAARANAAVTKVNADTVTAIRIDR